MESLQSHWVYAKSRHFKAWVAEYEAWPDEQSQIRAKEWGRSAPQDVDELTNEWG